MEYLGVVAFAILVIGGPLYAIWKLLKEEHDHYSE